MTTNPAELTATESLPPPNGKKRRRPSGYFFLFAIMIALFPFLVRRFPAEIAAWHVAAAMEKMQDEDYAGAIDRLEVALQWHERNVQAYLQRARCRQEQGNFPAALADCDQALEISPGALVVQFERAEILQSLGRHEEAIEVFEVLSTRWRDHGSRLNMLAYARAVGNRELDQALGESEEAVETLGGLASMVEVAGFLEHLLGREDEAAAYFDQAIKLVNDEHSAFLAKHGLSGEGDAKTDSETENGKLMIELQLARLHYYRSLVHRSSGRAALAEADLADMKKLGHDVDSFKSMLPSSPEEHVARVSWAIQNVLSAAAYFDTRGFVHYRRGDYELAKKDLDVAVAQAELASTATRRSVRIAITDQQARDEQKRLANSLAVIRYHRSLVNDELGLKDEAERDRKRVRELGFQPDDSLF